MANGVWNATRMTKAIVTNYGVHALHLLAIHLTNPYDFLTSSPPYFYDVVTLATTGDP